MRARLLACLAQELYWHPSTERRRDELSAEALVMARRIGDAHTLGAVLCARNLAIMGPDNSEERVANAEESLAIARELGDTQLEHHSLFHLFTPLGELNRVPEAMAAFRASYELALTRKDPVGTMIGPVFAAGAAVLEGRFADAEALLSEAFRLGQELREPNALITFEGAMLVLRYLQGRSVELLGSVAEGVRLYPVLRFFIYAVIAGAFVAVGMDDEARYYLEQIDFEDHDGLRHDVFLTFCVNPLGNAIARLHDVERARAAYRRFAPYSGRNGHIATIGFGSVDLGLGQLAAVLGQWEDAERHFEAALASNAANGWQPMVADTELEYAAALAERGDDADRDRIVSMLNHAIEVAQELGMPRHERDATALRDELLGTPVVEGKRRRLVTRRDRVRARLTSRTRTTVARWTRDDTDEDLARRFGGRIAQRTLFGAMARAFQPSMAFGFEGDITFKLLPPVDEVDPAAADWWTVEVRGRKATARRGGSDSPAVLVHVTLADFVRLAAGELHSIRAIVERRLYIEGDVGVAVRLGDLFGAIAPQEGLARAGTEA